MYHQSSLALGIAIFTHIPSTLIHKFRYTIHIHVSFCQGVYTLQILPIASLVGQDVEKVIAMGVQLTFIVIQDRKDFSQNNI